MTDLELAASSLIHLLHLEASWPAVFCPKIFMTFHGHQIILRCSEEICVRTGFSSGQAMPFANSESWNGAANGHSCTAFRLVIVDARLQSLWKSNILISLVLEKGNYPRIAADHSENGRRRRQKIVPLSNYLFLCTHDLPIQSQALTNPKTL